MLGVSREAGVVVISYDWRNFRLSWMPVTSVQHPRFDRISIFMPENGSGSTI